MHLVLKKKGNRFFLYLRHLSSERAIDDGLDLQRMLKRWLDYPVKLRIK